MSNKGKGCVVTSRWFDISTPSSSHRKTPVHFFISPFAGQLETFLFFLFLETFQVKNVWQKEVFSHLLTSKLLAYSCYI